MINKIIRVTRIFCWNLYYCFLRVASSVTRANTNPRGGPGTGTGTRRFRRSIQILFVSVLGVFCLVLLQGRFIWIHLSNTNNTRTNINAIPSSTSKIRKNEKPMAVPVGLEGGKPSTRLMINNIPDSRTGEEPNERVSNENSYLEDSSNTEATDETSTCHRILSFAEQKANVQSTKGTPFPMSKIWMESIVDILLASQHPDDPEYSHQTWTKNLLAELSPTQLERTIVLPDQLAQRYASGFGNASNTNMIKGFDRIIELLLLRLESPELHPPLRIAVLGGASTEGKNCQQVADTSKVHIPQNSMMNNPTYCAWPYRFESFVNTLAGIPVIKVVNMGEEGTSTLTKTPLLKYWMYPKQLLPEGPDVIIHSYQNQDALPLSIEEESIAETLAFETRILRDTMRLARPCGDPPVLVYMANPSELSDKTFLKTLMNKVAQSRTTKQQSGIIPIDYTRVMDHVISTDLAGTSLQSKVQNNDGGMMMAAHLVIMWILAYNVGNAILRHCDVATTTTDSGPTAVSAISESSTAATTCQESPCIFAWLAGPMGNVRTADEINFYINPFVVENYGWNSKTDMFTGWSRKAGLVAMTPKARIVLEYRDVPLTTRMINIMSVKSSISSFKHSRAAITVTVLNHQTKNVRWEHSIEVDGFFVPNQDEPNSSQISSITFPSLIDLKTKSALKGETIRLEIDLVQGITFKILGMMFCSR